MIDFILMFAVFDVKVYFNELGVLLELSRSVVPNLFRLVNPLSHFIRPVVPPQSNERMIYSSCLLNEN